MLNLNPITLIKHLGMCFAKYYFPHYAKKQANIINHLSKQNTEYAQQIAKLHKNITDIKFNLAILNIKLSQIISLSPVMLEEIQAIYAQFDKYLPETQREILYRQLKEIYIKYQKLLKEALQ